MNGYLDFVFDGQKLSDFGWMALDFNNSTDENIIASSMNYGTIYSPAQDRWIHISSSYESPLTLTLQIGKNVCEDEERNIELTNREISEITKWLCRKTYKEFYFINNDPDIIYHEAKIDANVILLKGRKVGVELTITTNRPYGITKPIEHKFEAVADDEYRLVAISDEEKDIYPDIFKVKLKSSGDLKIRNLRSNRTTEIKNCIKDEEIILDGKTMQIMTSNNAHNLADDFNYNFPFLVCTYESDITNFKFSLNCDVEISYRGIRKVGLDYA